MIASYMLMGQQAKGTTTDEVLRNAGLDFEVGREPLYTAAGREVRSKFQRIKRMDNDVTLGVVGRTYHPMQNRDLLGIADRLVQNQDITWDRIGMVGAGEKLYASFKLPDTYRIDGWDDLDQYIYLTNTHDGSGGVKCIPANIRFGCTNQFAFHQSQLKKAGINPRDLTIRHSSKMADRISQFEHAIRLVDTLNNNFANEAAELMTVEMTEADKATFYIDALGLTTDEKLVDVDNEWGLKTRGLNTYNHLKELEKASTNNSSNMVDSAWQSFNVITEFIDHAWVHNASGTVNAKRVESSVLGTGARLKAKAWDTITARIVA